MNEATSCSTSNVEKINLLGLTQQQLIDLFVNLGEKPYRGQQLLKWIHQVGVSDFEAMSNVSKTLRQRLTEIAEIKPPEFVFEKLSDDGTFKWIVRLADGNCVETVFIPETGRGTLCISSQVGCALNCSFCSTAQQGFNRNLSSAEIIGQVWLAVRRLAELQPPSAANKKQVTNVVLMGMGEPLLNFSPVVDAMDIMMHDFGYGLAKRRVTLSTSGVVPAMEELAKVSECALAVSLHAPNDNLRDELVPINKKYPLTVLMNVCKNYFPHETKRKITFEYVMLDGVNDSNKHARELVRLLEGVPAKVNLIPFNPFPNTHYQCSDHGTILQFQNILQRAGLVTTIRKTRGDDIDAACGQLVGKVADKTRRKERNLRKIHQFPISIERKAVDN